MAEELSRCYKVSEITKCIKDYLEGEFYSIKIEGEVSGFKPSSSGHFYFTLKDSTAAISAVLFARSVKNAGYLPKDGDLVVVTGSVTVYAKSGNYQIVSVWRPRGCLTRQKSGLFRHIRSVSEWSHPPAVPQSATYCGYLNGGTTP